MDADTSQLLAAVWAETATRVRGFLITRGVPATSAEDITQEVAVRALRTRVAFVAADDLVPWACTVAWRIHLEDLRRLRRRPAVELVDQVSSSNVEEEALAHVRLSTVMCALSSMSDRDRLVLVAAVTTPRARGVEPRETQRLAVARHRARRRLIGAVGTISARQARTGRQPV